MISLKRASFIQREFLWSPDIPIAAGFLGGGLPQNGSVSSHPPPRALALGTSAKIFLAASSFWASMLTVRRLADFSLF